MCLSETGSLNRVAEVGQPVHLGGKLGRGRRPAGLVLVGWHFSVSGISVVEERGCSKSGSAVWTGW